LYSGFSFKDWTCVSIFWGSHSSSESKNAIQFPFDSLIPRFRVLLMPEFSCHKYLTWGNSVLMILPVLSVEPSSMTIISKGGIVWFKAEWIALVTKSLRLKVGMIADI
jgi:hypothetical protein